MTYADSSFLVSVYAADANTAAGLTFLERHRPRLPFAFLHWPEVAASLWKGCADAGDRWEIIEEDLATATQIYPLPLDADRVARFAAGLMKGYARRWNKLRTIDVMHVAAAVEAGADQFLSFDSASFQRVLAHTQRLKVWPPLTEQETARLALK